MSGGHAYCGSGCRGRAACSWRRINSRSGSLRSTGIGKGVTSPGERALDLFVVVGAGPDRAMRERRPKAVHRSRRSADATAALLPFGERAGWGGRSAGCSASFPARLLVRGLAVELPRGAVRAMPRIERRGLLGGADVFYLWLLLAPAAGAPIQKLRLLRNGRFYFFLPCDTSDTR